MFGRNAEAKIETMLGKGTQVSGDFTAEGSARIDGKVEGDVSVTGMLIVGSTASISGSISAASAMIGGEVLGDVVAKEKAELTATAKVLGDITTSVLVIDEHAVFQGRCDMNQEVPGKKVRPKRVGNTTGRVGRKSAKAALAEALKEVQEENQMADAPAEETASNGS